MSTVFKAFGLPVARKGPGNSAKRYYDALTKPSPLPSQVSPHTRAEIIAARQRRAAEKANEPAEEAARQRRQERAVQEAADYQRKLAQQARKQAALEAQMQHEREMALIEARARATEADAQSRAARSHTPAPSMPAPSTYRQEYPPPPSQNFGYGGYPGMPVIFNNAGGSGPGHCGCGPFGYQGHIHGHPHQPLGNPSNPHNHNPYSGGHQQRQQSPQPDRSPSPRRSRSRQRRSSASPNGAAHSSANNILTSLMTLFSGGGNGSVQVTPIITSASSKSNDSARSALHTRYPPQPTVRDDDDGYAADHDETDYGGRGTERPRSRSRSQGTRSTGSASSRKGSQKLRDWPTAPQSKQSSRTPSPAPWHDAGFETDFHGRRRYRATSPTTGSAPFQNGSQKLLDWPAAPQSKQSGRTPSPVSSLHRSATPRDRDGAQSSRISGIPQHLAGVYSKADRQYEASSGYASDSRSDSVEDPRNYDTDDSVRHGENKAHRYHVQSGRESYEDP